MYYIMLKSGFIYLLLVLKVLYAHQCFHDQVTKQVKLILPDSTTPNIYKLEPATAETPLKITSVYYPFQGQPNPQLDEMINKLVGISKEFWKRVLKVKSTKIMFPPNERMCAMVEVTPDQRVSKDSDLHFFVTVEEAATQTFVAWAAPCAIAPNGRPIFGQINFNSKFISVNVSNYNFQKYIETTIHETIHVLGFSNVLFDYWSKKPKIVNQYGFVTLQTPEIKKWMHQHFSCQLGAPLQNQGDESSRGSHWERSVFQNQLMTATDLNSRLIFSNLTMAVLQSTGWYKVDRSLAETYLWGKNQGCRFISSLCKGNFPEYCYNPGAISCTNDNTAIASCISDPFSDNCNYYSAYKNTICQDQSSYSLQETGSIFTHNSRCFKSNIIRSGYTGNNLQFRCYKAQCVGGVVFVTIGPFEILCNRSSQTINIDRQNFKGYLKCPDNLKDFCQSANYTQKYCYQNGYSISGQCICAEGTVGKDCNGTCIKGWHQYQESCVRECPNGSYFYQNQNTCLLKCPSGTWESNTICADCPQYCLNCSKGNCISCRRGSQLLNGKCVALVPLSLWHMGIVFYLALSVLLAF